MNALAKQALNRVQVLCGLKVGYGFEFLEALLLQLLSQWIDCGRPDQSAQRVYLAGKIFKQAKRVRRKQVKRGETQQPEVTIAMAREMADIAIAEWQAIDAETSKVLLAACPAPDFFEDDDE